MREKPEYYYNQSGVIPFRIVNGKVEILLITSRRKKHWVIPKGIIEMKLDPKESAIKEAHEEAGIKGTLIPSSSGKYSYTKWGGICNVEVYLMEVTEILDNWPESHRERKWFSITKAGKVLKNSELGQMLQTIPEEINHYKEMSIENK
jgi:phosphohistidine phosphatase